MGRDIAFASDLLANPTSCREQFRNAALASEERLKNAAWRSSGKVWWPPWQLKASLSSPVCALRVVGLERLAEKEDGDHIDARVFELAFHGSGEIGECAKDPSAQLVPSKVGTRKGRVHSKFQEAYLSIREGLQKELKANAKGTILVIVTGHGLGAVLATFASYEFACMDGYECRCITWACPRIGDRDFAADIATKVPQAARFLNKFDPVPRLPPNSADPNDDGQFGLEGSTSPKVPDTDYFHIWPGVVLDPETSPMVLLLVNALEEGREESPAADSANAQATWLSNASSLESYSLTLEEALRHPLSVTQLGIGRRRMSARRLSQRQPGSISGGNKDDQFRFLNKVDPGVLLNWYRQAGDMGEHPEQLKALGLDDATEEDWSKLQKRLQENPEMLQIEGVSKLLHEAKGSMLAVFPMLSMVGQKAGVTPQTEQLIQEIEATTDGRSLLTWGRQQVENAEDDPEALTDWLGSWSVGKLKKQGIQFGTEGDNLLSTAQDMWKTHLQDGSKLRALGIPVDDEMLQHVRDAGSALTEQGAGDVQSAMLRFGDQNRQLRLFEVMGHALSTMGLDQDLPSQLLLLAQRRLRALLPLLERDLMPLLESVPGGEILIAWIRRTMARIREDGLLGQIKEKFNALNLAQIRQLAAQIVNIPRALQETAQAALNGEAEAMQSPMQSMQSEVSAVSGVSQVTVRFADMQPQQSAFMQEAPQPQQVAQQLLQLARDEPETFKKFVLDQLTSDDTILQLQGLAEENQAPEFLRTLQKDLIAVVGTMDPILEEVAMAENGMPIDRWIRSVAHEGAGDQDALHKWVMSLDRAALLGFFGQVLDQAGAATQLGTGLIKNKARDQLLSAVLQLDENVLRNAVDAVSKFADSQDKDTHELFEAFLSDPKRFRRNLIQQALGQVGVEIDEHGAVHAEEALSKARNFVVSPEGTKMARYAQREALGVLPALDDIFAELEQNEQGREVAAWIDRAAVVAREDPDALKMWLEELGPEDAREWADRLVQITSANKDLAQNIMDKVTDKMQQGPMKALPTGHGDKDFVAAFVENGEAEFNDAREPLKALCMSYLRGSADTMLRQGFKNTDEESIQGILEAITRMGESQLEGRSLAHGLQHFEGLEQTPLLMQARETVQQLANTEEGIRLQEAGMQLLEAARNDPDLGKKAMALAADPVAGFQQGMQQAGLHDGTDFSPVVTQFFDAGRSVLDGMEATEFLRSIQQQALEIFPAAAAFFDNLEKGRTGRELVGWFRRIGSFARQDPEALKTFLLGIEPSTATMWGTQVLNIGEKSTEVLKEQLKTLKIPPIYHEDDNVQLFIDNVHFHALELSQDSVKVEFTPPVGLGQHWQDYANGVKEGGAQAEGGRGRGRKSDTKPRKTTRSRSPRPTQGSDGTPGSPETVLTEAERRERDAISKATAAKRAKEEAAAKKREEERLAAEQRAEEEAAAKANIAHVSVTLTNVDVNMKDLQWSVKQKTLPFFSGGGAADLLIEGVHISLRFQLQQPPAEEQLDGHEEEVAPSLALYSCNVDIGKLKMRFPFSTMRGTYEVVWRALREQIRRTMINQITAVLEEQAATFLDEVNPQLREMWPLILLTTGLEISSLPRSAGHRGSQVTQMTQMTQMSPNMTMAE